LAGVTILLAAAVVHVVVVVGRKELIVVELVILIQAVVQALIARVVLVNLPQLTHHLHHPQPTLPRQSLKLVNKLAVRLGMMFLIVLLRVLTMAVLIMLMKDVFLIVILKQKETHIVKNFFMVALAVNVGVLIKTSHVEQLLKNVIQDVLLLDVPISLWPLQRQQLLVMNLQRLQYQLQSLALLNLKALSNLHPAC